MGRKSKKFIDPKRDVVHTFKLVHRSQKDPLVADENAPQNVLVGLNEVESRKEQLHKFGIYFDDDYDYLQHLRGATEAVEWIENDIEVYTIKEEDFNERSEFRDNGLLLPSSVFESHVEEPIGLLNKAAPITGPRPELDPDIVAEMDEAEFGAADLVPHDDTDAFPDDFVAILNADAAPSHADSNADAFGGIRQWLGSTEAAYDHLPVFGQSNEYDGGSELYRDYESAASEEDNFAVSDDGSGSVEGDEGDRVADLPSIRARRGPRSSASRASASSSTVPRSELLSRLDERFEKLFANEYGDENVGPLDDADVEGACCVDSEAFKQVVEATLRQLDRAKTKLDGVEKDRTVSWVRDNLQLRESRQQENEWIQMDVSVKAKPEYDCESILSTYSNIRNRPQLIDDSHLFKKSHKLTMKVLKQHNKIEGEPDEADCDRDADEATILSCISALSFRPKNESPQERRDRKAALRELRKERRIEKKTNKLAFKEELKKQKTLHLSQAKTRIIPVV